MTAEDYAYIEDEKKTREEVDRLERGIMKMEKKMVKRLELKENLKKTGKEWR